MGTLAAGAMGAAFKQRVLRQVTWPANNAGLQSAHARPKAVQTQRGQVRP